MPIKSVRDLRVYAMAYEAAMEVFEVSKGFPAEERYSLTDQVRRSSRSVPINIREGYAKRRYQNIFYRHLADALGSSEETRGWLEFARDCGYLAPARQDALDRKYDAISSMLHRLAEKWETR